jgi:DNA repair exonuclease SbcCD ATPase subunit
MNNTDENKLEAGENSKAIESGEDLAISALASAGSPNSTDEMDEVAASDDLAQTLESLQNIIERNANELARVKDELKEKRESLKSVFENDAPLQEIKNEVEVMSQQVKERKAKINNDPQATSLKLGIGELNQEKKEIEETLSNHLINYYSMTNSKSFDTAGGDQWEFDIKAKVKGKPSA